MTLTEDMDRQGQNVWDLIDLWQDSSEAVMRDPQTTREDLQEETFKWIRRFRELMQDQQRTEAELAGLRTSIREGKLST